MEEYLNKAKKKAAIAIVSGLVSLTLFISPVLIGAAAVAVPVVAVANFFQQIGDFIFGVDDESNEVIQLMNELFTTQKSEYISLYESYTQVGDIEIPYEYLIVVNTLAGLEIKDTTTSTLEEQQACAISEDDSLASTSTYVNCLKKSEPWSSGFDGVSVTTIEGYINYYKNLFKNAGLDKDFLESLEDSEFVYPLDSQAVVTSEFGGRELGPIGGVDVSYHTGIDLAFNGGEPMTCGRPVYAVMGGTVTKTQDTVGQAGANWGEITQEGGLSQWYLHLNSPFLYNVGDKVNKGDLIGYIGSTGLSYACHLHLEFRVNGVAHNAREFMDFDNPKLPNK